MARPTSPSTSKASAAVKKCVILKRVAESSLTMEEACRRIEEDSLLKGYWPTYESDLCRADVTGSRPGRDHSWSQVSLSFSVVQRSR